MTINELNETTNNMIKEFVNQLGWNGDFRKNFFLLV